MQTADFTPDLSGLEQDYQVLTELDQAAESRTYLARHLRLNRDVTITVVAAATDADRAALARFEADVNRLKGLRHANVIPVIEGRRLTNDQFAVIRARVRGSSLDQLVSAVGPIPQQRVAGILDQVRAALEWARENGIADRHVAQNAMIFQQGSGRVLLSFDLPPGGDGTPSDECDDARTIGALSWEMLSGQQPDASELRPLAELRPDLSRAIVAETNELVHCGHGGRPRDIAAYIALLSAAGATTQPVRTLDAPAAWTNAVDPKAVDRTVIRVAPTAPSPAPPAASPAAPSARVAEPVVTTGAPPTMASLPPSPLDAHGQTMRRRTVAAGTGGRRGRWGFGARFASAVVIIAVLAAIGYYLLGRERGVVVDRTAVGTNPTPGQAAGEIGTPARTDPSALPPLSRVPTGAARRADAPAVEDSLNTVAPPSDTASGQSGIVPPTTRRHEPPRTSAPLVFPAPSSPPAQASRDSASGSDICNSPSAVDQHRCLMRSIDDNDTVLNAVYNRLIVALRTQAKTDPDGADSDAVERLRSVQRNWLDVRDQRCHNVGSGALYARDRAKCFAEESAKRTRELSRQLEAIRTSAPDTGTVVARMR